MGGGTISGFWWHLLTYCGSQTNEGLFPFVSHFGVQSETAEEGGDIGRSIPQININELKQIIIPKTCKNKSKKKHEA